MEAERRFHYFIDLVDFSTWMMTKAFKFSPKAKNTYEPVKRVKRWVGVKTINIFPYEKGWFVIRILYPSFPVC